MNSTAFPLAVELTLLPQAGFQRAAEVLAPIFRKYSPVVDYSAEERHDLALSMIDADNGDYATDEEVTAAFRDIHAAAGL